MEIDSQTFMLVKSYLGRNVSVVMDRPLGTRHPKHGFVPGTKVSDGEELDAYYLGVVEPLERAAGICIAVVHRKNDDDDKLIVVPVGINLSKEDIVKAIHFQEQWFDMEIILQ